MKVIVEHDEKASGYLAQYTTHIEYLGLNYKIIDIEEKYLPWLGEIVRCIEPNFTIELSKNEEHIRESLLDSQDMLLVSGAKCANERIDAYYNITTHTLEQNKTRRDTHRCQWINCYSTTDKIEAAEYIKCMRYLRDIASEGHKPIVIYANIHIPNETYRYRTLTYKIINSYLAELNGVLITKSIKSDSYKYYTPSRKSYEFYLDESIYLEDSLDDVVIKAIPFLSISQDHTRFKNMYKDHRQSGVLYDDVFYEAISPDQEIYVLLNLVKFREPAYYEALGLDHIPIVGSYGMLYAKKSVFDELNIDIRADVPYPYYTPILSRPLCNKRDINQKFSYDLIAGDLKYKGRGVYIGIVTNDDVDYTNDALRTKDGGSRIACIWQQIRADQGTYYYKEQIDEELASTSPGQIIKLPDGDSMSTMMLGIAGGISETPDYRGIAIEAEFVVAKVNTAPEGLQRIYGGMPSENTITLADAMVGALKLINFAREQGKPLVLCIPFNSNLDAHDGSLTLYEMLGLLAKNDYLTIIIPVGEEADKMHHYGVSGQQPNLITITMNVKKENQNIIGVIYQRYTSIFTTTLYPPQGVVGAQPIDLNTAGVTRLNEATIYSNGYRISFYNGAIRIFFRIESPQVGEWKIEIKSNIELVSQIDIWISQQELNEYITLNPSTPFITVGSTANTNNIMAVGGYDKEGMVVLRSSGRGFSWDNRVKPLFITNANNIIAPCKLGEWVSVTGTVPAASIMLGVVATLYSKFNEEQVFPFPNTVVMNSVILSQVEQFQGVEYPNPNQGYGIFDIQALNKLLTIPFVL